MAKTTRLYRVENMWGNGLYGSNANIGTILREEVTLDTDLYEDGRLREVEYHDRGGMKRTWRRDGVSYEYLMDVEAPEQLCIELEEFAPKRKSMWDMLRDSVSGYNPFLSGYMSARDYIQDPQLRLDLAFPEPRVMKHTLCRGSSMTISDLLEFEYHGKWTQILACAEDNRPKPHDDGIEAPEGVFGNYLFAFESLEKLSAWLDGITAADIIKLGGVIRVLDVTEPIIGKCQAIYKPGNVVKSFTICNTGQHKLQAPKYY